MTTKVSRCQAMNDIWKWHVGGSRPGGADTVGGSIAVLALDVGVHMVAQAHMWECHISAHATPPRPPSDEVTGV